jgi:hypothetical protein
MKAYVVWDEARVHGKTNFAAFTAKNDALMEIAKRQKLHRKIVNLSEIHHFLTDISECSGDEISAMLAVCRLFER